MSPGDPGSFRSGHDPQRFEALEGERYDAVLATVPSDVFVELLELDRGFSPFYWTNIADPELPFVGVIEHTNLIGRERYGGRRFLYVANYLAPGHELRGHPTLVSPSSAATNAETARGLWALSERLTGVTYELPVPALQS